MKNTIVDIHVRKDESNNNIEIIIEFNDGFFISQKFKMNNSAFNIEQDVISLARAIHENNNKINGESDCEAILRNMVFVALDNLISNGYNFECTPVPITAQDLINDCVDFERYKPDDLIPYIRKYIENRRK